MIPGLGEAMLAVPAMRKEEDHKSADGEGLEGDQLFDFQSILLPLLLSNAAAIDPSSFISHFSFFGEPVNPLVQMDSQEFLSVFFDRLSTSLARTSSPHLLHSFVGGKLSNQISSLTCPHRQASAEAFFMLSLNVQHHKDVRSSLAEFFKPELLTGANAWMCSECRGKVEAERRSVVVELPQVLILHLKRFEFDFDSMRKKKLNDYCEFPTTLNMRAYIQQPQDDDPLPPTADSHDSSSRAPPTQNGQSEAINGADGGAQETAELADEDSSDDCLYDLVGVVIHSGHADAGHYWSLVKDRFTSASPSTTAQLTSWLCFNDQRVSPFFIEDLPAEAFGGMEGVTVDVAAQKDKTGPQTQEIQVEKQRSAYILLFAKRAPHVVPQGDVQGEAEGTEVKGLQRPATAFHEFPSSLPVSSLPPYLHELYAVIQQSNLQLLRDQLALDPPYSVFMLRCFLHAYDGMRRHDHYPVQGKLNLTYSLCMLHSVAMFTLNVMTRARNVKRLEQFVALVQHMVAMHVPACYWLLERFIADDHCLLRQCLLDAPAQSRRLTAALLDLALAKLIRWELDADYQDRLLMLAIQDKDKEKAAAEGDADFAPSTPATPATPSTPATSIPGTPAGSAPSSAANSPVLGPIPSSAAPPLPPRALSTGSAPAAAPAVPPRALPTVDATLAPDNMFKVKSAVSVASPLTVLHGIGAPSAKALTAAGISSVLQLAQVKERPKKDYNTLLSSSKLSTKQLNDAVDKARQAVQFIRQIGGDEQLQQAAVKPPSPTPSPTVAAPSIPQRNGDATAALPPMKKAEFAGLNEFSILPRFVSACLWLLQSAAGGSNSDAALTVELVELLTRFARRAPACARLLIERGALDALLALYLGQSPDVGGAETSQADSTGSRGAEGAPSEGAGDSRHNSFSATSTGLTIDSFVNVPPLPPLPELVPTSSSASATYAPPPPASPTSGRRPPAYERPLQGEYDQGPTLVLLVHLVKYCRMAHWPDDNLPPTFVPSAAPHPRLAAHTAAALRGDAFLARLAHQPPLKSNMTQTECACHLSWLDLSASLRLSRQLLAVMQHAEAVAAWPALCQLQGLFTLADDEALLTQRIQQSLPTLLTLLQANSPYYKLTDLTLRFLLTLQQAQPLLQAQLLQRLDELSWLPAWLQHTKKPPTRSQPIFLDDGRVIALHRDYDYREQQSKGGEAQADPWTLPIDVGKAYKALVEEGRKQAQLRQMAEKKELSRGDSLREQSTGQRAK